MRILTFDELTPPMERDRILVNLAAFGGVFSRRRVDLYRSALKCLSDYAGLFAVDKDRVLGHVFVLRIPYVFRDGPELISGIATVGTRPDFGRSGVARSLLTEAHRRERDAGLRYSALWTNRSWGAHGLYEKLGYQDVYSPPWFVHAPVDAGRRTRRGPGVSFARSQDLDDIDRLHDRLAEGRLGYCRRPKGFSRAEVRLEAMDPTRDVLVARRGGELVGYALLDRNPRRVVCGELVATSPSVRKALIAEVGRVAKGVPFAFQHTVVSDAPELFREASYATSPIGWYAMMGNDLGRAWSADEAIRQFATRDPRFICLAGDRF